MKPCKQTAEVNRGLDSVMEAVRNGGVMPADTIDDIFRVANGVAGVAGPLLGATMPLLGSLI